VRCNHPPDDSDVGQVLAIGVEVRVWWVGRPRKCERVSAGERRPVPDR
jgi:hypothetical protein